MLLPCILVGWLNLQGPPGQEDRVVQVLQVEQHPRQVQQDLRVIWRHGEGPPETLDRRLRVALYTPEVGDLIINFHGLWFLPL